MLKSKKKYHIKICNTKEFHKETCRECGWSGCSCQLLIEYHTTGDGDQEVDVFCPKCGSDQIDG